MLEKACQLDPDDPEAQFQLGTIYDKAKSAPNAVQHFRKSATLNPRRRPSLGLSGFESGADGRPGRCRTGVPERTAGQSTGPLP